MDLWKQGHVAPQAAATELRVAGLAQWVCFVRDRWQEKVSSTCKGEVSTESKICVILQVGKYVLSP